MIEYKRSIDKIKNSDFIISINKSRYCDDPIKSKIKILRIKFIKSESDERST